MRAQHKRLLKIGLPVFLVVFLLLLGFGLRFWSFGSVRSEAMPAISLQDVHGSVEVQPSGSSDWRPAQDGMVVRAGDRVRTGDQAGVTIAWGDRGVTRVDPQTDIAIQDVPADANAVRRTMFRLQLSGGRIWSRLLKLMDIDSGFHVESDGVVATVRGTAFGFARSASSTEAAVTESVVTVSSASGTPVFLRDNQLGTFTATGTPTLVRDVSADDAWVSQNAQADDAYDAAAREAAAKHFQSLIVHAPTWLVRLSERMHLDFASGTQKEELRAAYLSRHIAEDLSGSAVSLADELPQGAARERALHDVRLALFLEASRPGFAPDPRLVSLLEGTRMRLLGTGTAETLYAQALDLDDRIDSLLHPSQPLDPSERTRLADQISRDITSWQSGFGASGLPRDTEEALVLKADALHDRIAGLETQAEIPMQTPTSTEAAPTSSAAVPPPSAFIESPRVPSPTVVAPLATSTAPAEPVIQVPVTTIVPVVQPCVIASVAVTARPSAALVGSQVVLGLNGNCTDGTTKDLTANTTFTTGSPNDGRISGNVFIPASAGTLTVYGSYTDASGTKRGSTKILASPVPRTLTSIDVSAIGSTSLTTGQRAMLDAVANYSDGTTADIAYQCAWSTSNPQLAMISGTVFQTLSGTGTVQAICTYAEGGVTQSGSVVFTISLDPALTPTNTGGATQRYYTTFVP